MAKHVASAAIKIILACLALKSGAQQAGTENLDPKYKVYTAIEEKWVAAANAGKFDSALFYANQARAYIEDTWGYFTDLNASVLANMIGRTYLVLNDNQNALGYYKKGTELFAQIAQRQGGLNPFYINQQNSALFYLGVIYFKLGSWVNAQQQLATAGPFLKAGHNLGDYLECEMYLAIVYDALGNFASENRVYDTLMQVLSTIKKSDWDYYRQASIYNNIADIYSRTGNPAAALAYIKKAADVYTAAKIENKKDFYPDYLGVLINVADGYNNIGQTDSALRKCKQVEDSLTKHTMPLVYASLLAEMGAINMGLLKTGKAIDEFSRCIEIYDSAGVFYDYYENSLTSLAALYTNTGQYRLADSILRRQINYWYSKGLTSSYSLQQSLAGLCKSLLLQGRNAEAADSVVHASQTAIQVLTQNFPGMPEDDKLKFLSVFDGVFDMLYTLLSKNYPLSPNIKKLAFAIQMRRKNIVLSSQTNILVRLRAGNDTAAAGAYTQWLNTRQMVANQYALPATERFLDIDSLMQISNNIEKQASFANFKGEYSAGADVATNLPPTDKSTANIEFVQYRYIARNAEDLRYGAFVLKGGDSTPVFVPLCRQTALTGLMRDAAGNLMTDEQLAQKFYTPGSQGAAMLYRLIWQPLQTYLPGVQTIRYCTAGLLGNIAFNAICSTNGVLANLYALHRYSSLVAAATNKQQAVEITIWGNMDYNKTDTAGNVKDMVAFNAPPGLKPGSQVKSIGKGALPNFYTSEINDIKKVFVAKGLHVNTLEGLKATEENCKQNSTHINGVLHISTHGFYTPYDKKQADNKLPGYFLAGNANPLFRCGLAFAGVNHYLRTGQPLPGHDDGILTGYEISQLDLHNVQLVTLSACETGLGDITATEGNLGLQRAFKLAGVQNLLVSLWQVPAKQTARLLTKFYGYWLGGETLAGALQAAQKELRDEGRTPYEWAGFVLVE